MSRRVLFVCTGNTCRSPLAEALARAAATRKGLDDIVFESAGTWAVEGVPASELAVRVGSRHGVDLSEHRARRLTRTRLRAVDRVLAMTPSHVTTVRELDPRVPTSLITKVLPEHHPLFGRPVPDPFGGSEKSYEEVTEVLDECVRHLVAKLGETDSADGTEGEAR